MPIVFKNVYAGYASSRHVIRDVTLTISSNTVFIGPNASGKTTLFRVIAGLTPFLRGEVYIDEYPLEKIRGKPGLISVNLPETILPFNVPIRDIAKLYIESTGGDWTRFLELIEALKLTSELDKRFTRLSAGSKTLVLNSIAIATGSRYILLDEPFESVDPARRTTLLKEIVKVKGTVLLNTHTTWLLRFLSDWNAVLVVNGRTHGPIRVEDLVSSKITSLDVDDCILRVDVDERRICLSRSTGRPVSDMDSLDRLYEVVSWSFSS